jgi:hypothetical protein
MLSSSGVWAVGVEVGGAGVFSLGLAPAHTLGWQISWPRGALWDAPSYPSELWVVLRLHSVASPHDWV